MDFNDTPEQAEFRKTCRKWLEDNAELKSGNPVSYTHLTLPTI